MKKQMISTPILWLALVAGVNLFSSGRWTVAAAAWLAPFLALRFLAIYQGRRKWLLFYLIIWLTASIAWYGATPIWGPAHFIFMAVNALLGSLPFFLADWLKPKFNSSFASTLILPLAATALEYLTVNGNPIGNFGATGYSQYGVTILMQLTAVTGLLGLTFLINWTAATLDWAWQHGFVWQQVRTGLTTFSLICLFVIGYGTVRLLTAPDPAEGDTVSIASFTLAEIDMPAMNQLLTADRAAFRTQTQTIHADYLARTETAAAAGAKIILWPEMAGIGLAEDVQALLDQGQTLAQQHQIYLAMPTMTLFPDTPERPAENVLFMADPDGNIVLEHVKFGGNLIEGTLKRSGQLQIVETPYGTLSGIICWDTDFPTVIRQAGQQNVDILLSPALEWEGINPMHGEMSAFRAVENGLVVVRQADQGLSIVTDAYGRSIATADPLTASSNSLQTAVSTQGTDTVYAQIGDIVGLLSVVGFVLMLGWGVVSGRRLQVDVKRETAVVG